MLSTLTEKNKKKSVSFLKIKINNNFWAELICRHREITIPTSLEKLEKFGRIDNFRKVIGLVEGDYAGIYFNDSDVYKALEGVAYALKNYPGDKLEAKADKLIDIIGQAQRDDGYLVCYFQLSKTEKPWSDMKRHEDYCLGHMIEASLAYLDTTGKDKFLNIAIRMVENMMSVVGKGKNTGYRVIRRLSLLWLNFIITQGSRSIWILPVGFWKNGDTGMVLEIFCGEWISGVQNMRKMTSLFQRQYTLDLTFREDAVNLTDTY